MVISVFGYEKKVKYPICISEKCCEKKHVHLLLIGEKGKRQYVFIKDFNAFMYYHTLHCGRKNLPGPISNLKCKIKKIIL